MRTKIILIVAGIVAIVAVVLSLALRPSPEAAQPTPAPTGSASIPGAPTEPGTTPKPGGDEPGDGTPGTGVGVDEHNSHTHDGTDCAEPGPVSCEAPGDYSPSTEQWAAASHAEDFVAEFITVSPSETAGQRAERLSPYVAPGSSVATQPTVVAREGSGIVGMTATVKVTGSPFGIPLSSDGGWVYTVNASFTANYKEPSAPPTVWNTDGTWQVTLDPESERVIAVHESVPTIERL